MSKWIIRHNGYHKAGYKLFAAVQPFCDEAIVWDETACEKKSVIELQVDPLAEGFRIEVSEAQKGKQRITITGQDEAHLFYGVCDFENVYLPYAATREDRLRRQNLPLLFSEPLPPYVITSKPRIDRRGIWTWGHTIYDYRRFIDHMVQLKMNTLILWNDYVPTNIEDVLAYAHENYMQVYLGYAWGWDVKMPDHIPADYIEGIAQQAMAVYRTQYAHLPCDGIYFQTITEHANETIDGVSVAETVVELVNRIGGQLLAEYPELDILFGLHATSVKSKLDVVAQVDSRISIIWEDVGAFPWHYYADDETDFAETVTLTRRLQDLRPAGGFGGVLKGYVNLDWAVFRHPDGPSPIGVSHQRYIAVLEQQRQSFRRYFCAMWLKHAPKAQQLMQELRSDALMTVLVEDACFENSIPFPVAVYAALLWDDARPLEDILYEIGLHPDISFT